MEIYKAYLTISVTGCGISRRKSGTSHTADPERSDANAFAYGWRPRTTAGTIRHPEHATDGHDGRPASIGLALLS